jgi:hypothetical protein
LFAGTTVLWSDVEAEVKAPTVVAPLLQPPDTQATGHELSVNVATPRAIPCVVIPTV